MDPRKLNVAEYPPLVPTRIEPPRPSALELESGAMLRVILTTNTDINIFTPEKGDGILMVDMSEQGGRVRYEVSYKIGKPRIATRAQITDYMRNLVP